MQFNIQDHPHIDYGYAVTSHSSQGVTSDRVLIHIDTEQAYQGLINSRLAYVAISRGRFDAQIYTNEAVKLGEMLSRNVSKPCALETTHDTTNSTHVKVTKYPEKKLLGDSHRYDQGLGIG